MWFLPENPAPLLDAQKSPAYTMIGHRLTDIFLANAKADPNRPIIADQLRGVMRNRDVVLAILALKDSIQRLPGERIGILMPACNIMTVLYFSCLFAGKTPVLVNWTSGIRNMEYCIDNVEVQYILTARAVIERLQGRGIEFAALLPRFIYLEDVAKKITLPHKLLAKFRSYCSWQTLRKAAVPEIAAILFTSGSENRPKAVPLTHENLRSDMAATLQFLHLRQDECMLGMLPPFHSFGLMINLLLPPCAGLRMTYHANPTEGEMLARMIASYKITMLGGTPTFIGNIMRYASKEQVATVRLMALGAEKTSDAIQALIEERCPDAIILNGYGITECGPIVAFNRPEAPRFGTIGEPLLGLEWAVVDEACRHRLPADTTGMLLVRGPNIFSGYINYDGPSPFVEFAGKQWYRTGDLISVSPDGFFIFKGRLKRFVKIGGEMISLPAMEDILLNAYPGGAEQDGPVLAVESLGVDDQNPEITLFTTIPLEREEVNQTLRKAGLAPSNTVKNVVLLAEIPLLGSGKTDYRSLKTISLS